MIKFELLQSLKKYFSLMDDRISLWTKNWLTKKKLPFCFFEKAESSNDLAKARAFKKEPDGFAFLVHQQTKGRGYEDKIWQNSDLTISFLWEKNLREITVNSCEFFALDLKKALQKTWPALPLSVKAPNDLFLDSKKAAGILLEFVRQGSKTALIIGLGLNVFSRPKNLPAGFLAEKTKNIHPKTWESFLEQLLSLWNKRAVSL